ncbi:MAG: resolvase [Acidobacteria bacterium]|nr:MAG: resolvase [Acidobacteriota bacterium]
MNTAIFVAIYCRVSTRDKGQDFTNQLLALREFAAKQGWLIYHEYVDQVSGSTDERREFQQMFQDASQRKFDVLLFWSLDRLSREGVLETLQHLQRLSSYGVAWRSFTEQYLDSTGIFREAVIGILAAIAKQERVRLAERTRAGLERVRREGKTLGRPAAKADTATIRRMRDKGKSWSEIARKTGLSRGTCQKVCRGAATVSA